MKSSIWTIGHSNRDVGEFLQALASEQIKAIADVRRFPGSRRYPQFGAEALRDALQQGGISYQHFPQLGGRRASRLEKSPNTAWRAPAFKAYADYMLTDEFAAAFNDLAALAAKMRTAVMCAEILPWRCHRRLLADRFVTLGWNVVDVMKSGQVKQHELPPFASVSQGRLTYPG